MKDDLQDFWHGLKAYVKDLAKRKSPEQAMAELEAYAAQAREDIKREKRKQELKAQIAKAKAIKRANSPGWQAIDSITASLNKPMTKPARKKLGSGNRRRQEHSFMDELIGGPK